MEEVDSAFPLSELVMVLAACSCTELVWGWGVGTDMSACRSCLLAYSRITTQRHKQPYRYHTDRRLTHQAPTMMTITNNVGLQTEAGHVTNNTFSTFTNMKATDSLQPVSRDLALREEIPTTGWLMLAKNKVVILFIFPADSIIIKVI